MKTAVAAPAEEPEGLRILILLALRRKLLEALWRKIST